MDYKSILAIAEKNKKSTSKSDRGQYLTTKLSAPKKEKKDPKSRSHVIQKLIDEKDKEKKKKEEKERQRKLEEEKKNRFVIPKRYDSPLPSDSKEKMVADVPVTPDHFVNKTITDLRKNEGSRAERTKTKITVEARLSLEEKRLKIIEKLKNPEPEKHKDKVEKEQDGGEKHKILRDSDESNHSESKKRRTDSESKDDHSRREKHKSKSKSKSDEAHSKHKSESGKSQNKNEKLDSEKFKQYQQDTDVLKKELKPDKYTKPKPKRPPPPDAGLSFADLLKIAEVKSKDPITLEMLLTKPKEEKKARPMTQKEKEHLRREKESHDRKNDSKPVPKKETQLPPTERDNENNKGKEGTVKKDHNISNSSENMKKSSSVTSSNVQNQVAHSFKDKSGIRTSEKILEQKLQTKDKSGIRTSDKILEQKLQTKDKNGIRTSEKVSEQKLQTKDKNGIRTSEKVLEQKLQTRKEDIIKQEQSLKRNHQGQKIMESMTGKGNRNIFSGFSKNSVNRGIKTPDAKGDTTQKVNMNTKTLQRIASKEVPRLPSKDTRYDEEHENVLVCRPSSSEKQQENIKEKDTNKPKPKPVKEPTNPWDRIYGQIKANNPKPGKKRLVIESDDEDEYDDMDGFIDDGDDGNGNDYSSYIKEIFGYDKNRFKDEDDDIDNMESNFAQVEKEEKISARLGLQEDLEDMRKEEEELRLKMLAKKKKLKK